MGVDFKKYETKSLTQADDYQFTLSDFYRKVAEEELRETDQLRLQCIKAIRDWIMENPRIIKCRMDSKYIVKFLRFRKYSIPLAEEALERQLLFREGLYGYDFFSNLSIFKPHVLEFLEKGLIIPLPKRDKYGRLTVYYRFSLVDPSIQNIGNIFLSLMSLIMETLTDQEETQICGLNFIIDLSGAQLRQLVLFPLDVWYKLGKYYEKTCMCRVKSLNVINVQPAMMYLFKFFNLHLPQKFRDRLKVFSTNVAESGIVELDNLPIEYGGTIPLKTITDEWKKILISKQEFYDSYRNIKLNHALYPKDYLECTVESLKIPLNQMDYECSLKKPSNGLNGDYIVGSFRRLEID